MRSESILVKNEGQVIPPELLEKVLATNPSSIGCAVWHPEKGFVIDSEPAGTTVKEMIDHQADFKDQKVIYWFCDSISAVAKEDLQPFVIIGDKDDEGVVAFCAGAFSLKNDGQFSDAYVFAQKYLKPKLTNMFASAQEDVDTLAERLASEEFNTEMEMLLSPNKSTVALMLSGGKNFLWSEADRSTTADWGFVSDNLGWKETAATVAPKSEAVVPKKRFGVKASVVPPAETKPDAPVVQPANPAGTPDPNVYRPLTPPDEKVAPVNKGVTASDLVKSGAASGIAMAWIAPNPTMGIGKKKRWYKNHNHGVVPEGVDKGICPPVQIPMEEAMKMSTTNTRIVPAPTADNKSFASASSTDEEGRGNAPHPETCCVCCVRYQEGAGDIAECEDNPRPQGVGSLGEQVRASAQASRKH
jgi:hypothetical protein